MRVCIHAHANPDSPWRSRVGTHQFPEFSLNVSSLSSSFFFLFFFFFSRFQLTNSLVCEINQKGQMLLYYYNYVQSLGLAWDAYFISIFHWMLIEHVYLPPLLMTIDRFWFSEIASTSILAHASSLLFRTTFPSGLIRRKTLHHGLFDAPFCGVWAANL